MSMAPDPIDVTRLNDAFAGRYVIGREIGRGGMATVYEAEDTKHARNVAVKVLLPELAATLGTQRFLREIQLAATLNHPHILPLLDSGSVDAFLFYVMPLVSDASLRRKLQTEGPLPVDDAVRIAVQAASALAYAHARRVVHRDVKPENILLHEGEAMVADFGIARALAAPETTVTEASSLTGAGMVLGTLHYMSPEQALGGHSIDERSDVYSLGCVMYEMLAGVPPYAGSSAAEVLQKRLTEPPVPIRRMREAVPDAIARALAKALARRQADRFETMKAFQMALTLPSAVDRNLQSVAVLPFLNLSPDPENEYFADGITEDVIAQLSKIRSLKVISRTSVMAFKKREQSVPQIGATLNVSTLLDGSVRRAGNRVRIVAQLVDAVTDEHLWTDTYDRDLTDIFAIQTEVALHIAAALRAELSPDDKVRIGRPPTRDVEAYQIYLQGRERLVRFTEDGLRESILFFERALQRDANYALAYAGIAAAYTELVSNGAANARDALPRAATAVERALVLDSGLADAHCMAGQVLMLSEYDWAGAEARFKRALELNPSSADTYDLYGRMCSAVGRYDEAIAMCEKAQEYDPLAHRSDLSMILLRSGKYRDALAVGRRAVEYDPDYDRAHATLGWACYFNDLRDEAISELERAVSMSPSEPMWVSQLGEAYGLLGRIADARDAQARLEALAHHAFVSPYHRAYIHVGLGELDTAMDWLERAYEERSGAIYGIRGSFLFLPLRTHPRFLALLEKMHLPRYEVLA